MDAADETEVGRMGEESGPYAVLILVGEVDGPGGELEICAACEPDVTVSGASGVGFVGAPNATP